ncbi:MAG: hypothetical protein PHY93_09395 [Bacteriovorax sp.]|nr:hypothetical protein [Bacteriovorax sp.]
MIIFTLQMLTKKAEASKFKNDIQAFFQSGVLSVYLAEKINMANALLMLIYLKKKLLMF